VGSVAGASMCRSFKPMWKILNEMNASEKAKLASHMQRVIQSLDITDFVLLMSIGERAIRAAGLIL
jgi:hypothetical protein